MSLRTVEPPTLEVMRELAQELGFSMEESELEAHRAALLSSIEAYNLLDRMPDELPPVTVPRTPGYRPHPAENEYGAWYWKTRIEGGGQGKLAGKTVAIKDNICVAGVPMMNGASVLEGYVPEIDATVVTRILDAGGTIVGKTVCEYYCFSGGSHTSATGPVRNPRKPDHMAGGSSSGSAAVVAAGEADMALGGDQGGSIRIPAAYCGIVGMKPTHGLVPYTGIMPIELTLDHCGPMTATVADNALLLEVIAGPDGLDPRQYSAPSPITRARSIRVWWGCASVCSKRGSTIPIRKPGWTRSYAWPRKSSVGWARKWRRCRSPCTGRGRPFGFPSQPRGRPSR